MTMGWSHLNDEKNREALYQIYSVNQKILFFGLSEMSRIENIFEKADFFSSASKCFPVFLVSLIEYVFARDIRLPSQGFISSICIVFFASTMGDLILSGFLTSISESRQSWYISLIFFT